MACKKETVPAAAIVFLGCGWTVVPWRAEDIISCNNISPRICCTTCSVLSWSYLVKIPGIVSEGKEKSSSLVLRKKIMKNIK